MRGEMSFPDVTESRRAELLERARRRCFFLDVGDAAARLCRANMPYGIAKIHWMQESLGIEPDARYVSTPDSTVTRNRDRWPSGFGYGGVVEWSGSGMVPVELKPNCCGVLVAGLRDLPDLDGLRSTVGRVARAELDLEPVPARWDLDKGNHFLNLYEVPDPSVTGGCPWVVVMHSSGQELRYASELGPGLYLGGPATDGSLDALVREIPTPFGVGLAVTGRDARAYVEYTTMVEEYALRRREAYARAIFGHGIEVLFNETHQGFDGPGRMRLGCYGLERRALPWVPVTLRADLPGYLVEPCELYSMAALEREGLVDRARAEGCLDCLLGAAVLPHGSGYAYPEANGADVEVEDRGPGVPRRFRLGGGEWVESIRDLPYTYRGDEVIRRIEDLGAGRVVTELRLVADLSRCVPG
jgi:hypothetical protein